jgi:hypothetical protein
MSLRCPKCQSPNLQGLRLAYEETVRQVPTQPNDEFGFVADLAEFFRTRVVHGYIPPEGNSRSLLVERI